MNSPRSAGRINNGASVRVDPLEGTKGIDRVERADKIEERMALPERTCNSRTSSVVNELGPVK